MKDEQTENPTARAIGNPSPVQTFLLISAIVGTGAYNTILTPNAVSKEDVNRGNEEVLAEAKQYTDEQLEPIRRDMNSGFAEIKCFQLQSLLYDKDATLGSLIEKEALSPSSEYRQQIRTLKLAIDDLMQEKNRTCHKKD